MRKLFLLGISSCIVISGMFSLKSAMGTTSTEATTEVTTENNSESSSEDTTEATTEVVSGDVTTEESTTEAVATITITTAKNLNNQIKKIDYKLDEVQLESVNDKVPSADVEDKETYVDLSQNLNNLSKEYSWLISNNIISRTGKLENQKFKYTKKKTNAKFRKSELWMALHKIGYGTINSRVLLINDGTTYIDEYSYGDSTVHANNTTYYTYVTPNVYELYFANLLDKGLINKSEFNQGNGEEFLKDYEKYVKNKSKVDWAYTQEVATDTSKDIFGYSIELENGGTTITDKTPKYFEDEELYTIDALKIIETYMRATEKEMTAMEASIVTYKYGIHYLNTLSDEDKKTVEFLIAKGVLNYEDESELVNIYGKFTNEIAYKILYRVANPDARFDFSKITLTDQESFWQEKGFYENNVKLYYVNTGVPEPKTLTQKELDDIIADAAKYESESNNGNTFDEGEPEESEFEEDEDDNGFLDNILGWFKGTDTAYADTNTRFKVRKMFDNTYTYYYDNTNIKDLKTDDEEIADKDDITMKDNNTGSNKTITVITFEVEAKSYKSALAYVNNKITSDISALMSSEIRGYTTVEDESGNIVTLVPSSTLKKDFTKIAIVEDKLLINTETGTEAILLPESGYALVGNQIIVSDNIIVTESGGEIYYNLDMLAALMSNAALNETTNGEMYICSTNLKEEKVVTLKTSMDTSLGKVNIAKIKATVINDSGNESKKTQWYFNQSQVQNGINSLVRHFTVKMKDGTEELVTFVVDWNFIVAGDNVFQVANETANAVKKSRADLVEQGEVKGGKTVAEINQAFYTRPDGSPKAAEWWDSNISMSNSLANFMYGTSGVKYITNGYLAPSLTVLCSENISDSTIATIFKENGFKLDSTGKKYCDNTAKFWESYFMNPKMSDDSLNAYAQLYREYNCYKSKKVTNGYTFGEAYFLTDYGVLYKSVKQDARVELSNGNTVMTVQTRNSNNNEDCLTSGTKFMYGDKEFIYLRSKDGYFEIQPNYTLSGNVDSYGMLDNSYRVALCSINGKKVVLPFKPTWFLGDDPEVKLTSGKSYEDYVVSNTQNSINSDCGDYYYFSGLDAVAILDKVQDEINAKYYDPLFSDSATILDIVSSDGLFSLDSRTTCIETDKVYIGSTKGFTTLRSGTVTDILSSSENFRTTNNNTISDTIGALPRLRINSANYYFRKSNGSWVLEKGTLQASLNATDVSYSSISRKVIDSMVAKFSCVCNVNDLQPGQKIYIGDILFTKVGTGKNGVFVSEAVYNSSVATQLKNKTEEDEIRSVISGLFIGQSVTYSGAPCALTSYIDTCDVGKYLKSNAASNGVLWKDGKVLKIKDGDTDSTDMSKSASYVCIELSFIEGLLAQPVSADGSTYRLLTVSGVSGNDYVDNIPFFNESLSFATHKDSSISLDTVLDSTYQFFNDTKTQFKDMMDKAFKGDVINIIWSFMFSIASYMCVMSWALYGLLHYDIGRKYFRILTIPSLGGHGYRRSKGFDIIKIASFGIYDVDSDPTLARTLTVSFVCFFLMYSILHWIPR